MIHPTAVIGPNVKVAKNVSIGPFSIIDDYVSIGEGTEIGPHCHFLGWTSIGKNCKFHTGTVIGGPPQDHGYTGEESYVEIGDNSIFREYVTIHRGHREGHKTIVGNDCLMMAQSHLGHNCIIGSNVTIVNQVQCGGHVEIDDFANVGGMTGIHQFVRIGSRAMIGACLYLNQDVAPFSLIGRGPKCFGANLVGLRRGGVASPVIKAIKESIKLTLLSELRKNEAIARIEKMYGQYEEIQYFISFINKSKRGLTGK